MHNSQNGFDFPSLERSWKLFSSLIYNELKKLKLEKEKISIEINTILNLKKCIDISKSDINFMIEHKKIFIDIDKSLENIFDGLIQFKKINALNNSAVPILCRHIFNSEKIVNLINKLKELEVQKEKISERIINLEQLREENFFSDELIKELADYFELDKATSRKIRVYAIKKSGKKKSSQIKAPEQQKKEENIKDNIQEQKEESLEPIKTEKEKPKQEQKEGIYHTYEKPFKITLNERELAIDYGKKIPVKNKQKNIVLNDYRSIVSSFKKMNNRYSYLISKYKDLLKNIDINKIDDYEQECIEIEKEYHNIEEYKYKSKYEIKKIIILTYKLIEIRNKILNLVSLEQSKITEEDIEILKVYIDNFEKIAEELKTLDKSLIQEEIETSQLEEEKLIEETEEKKTIVTEQETNISEVTEINFLNNLKNQTKKYEQLKEKFRELANKYFEIINNLKPHEKEYYNQYISLNESKFKEEYIEQHNDENYDKAHSILLAIKFFELKEVIEDSIQKLSNSSPNIEEITYIEELIDELKNIGEKLEKIDTKLNEQSNEKNKASKPSNVFFLTNEEGNILLPEDSMQLIQAYAKLAESTDVDNIIKKKPFVLKNLDIEIDRIPFAQRINDRAISFVVVKTGEGSTGNGILVIASAPISGSGYVKIQNETQKVAKQHREIIKKQIELIESKNPEYYLKQEEIRKKIIKKVRG